MRNLKKFLALVLAMMMVFSLMITVNAAAYDDYTDKSSVGSRYKTGVEVLTNIGVFHGYGTNTTFNPTAEITRAEMAAIIYRVMTGDTEDKFIDLYKDYDNDFKDVNDEWFAPYVNYANNARIVVGDGNGRFHPLVNIDGYQVLAILLRALGYTQPGEFEGKDWQTHTAQIGAQLHITDNLAYTLSNKTPRQVVAQMTYNTAVVAERVSWTPAFGYNTIGESLIELGTPKNTNNIWGVKTVSTPYTFTYPEVDVKGTYDKDDEFLYEFFGPMTECDVAHEIPITKNTSYVTYTNGIGNKGAQLIQPLDTINTIGAQGRWTRIYSDRIVYMDTVLARVIDTTPATYDSGSHIYQAATSTVIIYANTAFQGVVNDPYGGSEGSGAGWKSSPINAAVDAAPNGSTTYTVEGSFTVGQFITANILTGTSNNQLTTGSRPVNPSTGSVYSASSCPARLRNAKVANPTSVVIDSITYEGVTSNRAVGFKGTDGQQYLYDVTYGYYPGVTNGTDMTNYVLGTSSLGRTFQVYTDGKNNVLGLIPVSAASGVGVITAAKAEQLNTATGTSFDYVVKYTILKPDNTYVEITAVPGANTFFNAGGAAGALAYTRRLVTYTYVGNNYYTVTPATPVAVNNAGGIANNTVFAGIADTLLGPTGPIMDDDTVIYVANYAMNNALASVPTRGAFATNGYTIYNGIKAMPNDLAAPTAPTELYDNGVQLTTATDNGMNPNTMYYYMISDASGDYVLVVHGANATPISKRAVTAPTYAYMQHDLLQNNVYDGYYVFNTLQNGYASTLRLNNSAGATVTTNGSGLYVVTPDSTNGTYSIEGGNVVNYLGTTTPAGTRTAWTGWSYYAGVLRLGSVKTVNNYNGDNNASKKYAANPLTDADNVAYLTVADNAQIFIVNPKTGNSVPATGYTLGDIAKIYGSAPNSWSATTRPVDIYFQTNEYGWINLVYVVDNTVATGGSAPSSTDVTFVLNIVNKDTGVAYQTYYAYATTATTYTTSALLNTVATAVGVSTTNLTQYGAIFVNGNALSAASLTTVNGGTYTIVINAYYTNA